MTVSRLRPVSALRSLATLHTLLERRGRNDQWLFEARGEAHQLSYEVAREGYGELQGACLATRDLFGHLLRHGVRDADEILSALGRLLEFLRTSLDASASIPAVPSEIGITNLGGHDAPGLPLAQHPEPANANLPELRLRPGADGGPASTARIEGRDAWRMVNETRLGEILVRQGRIDGRTLDQALVLQQVGCKRLGEVLVGMGKISADELKGALDHQRELTLKLAGGISLGTALKLPPPARETA